ncbi:MAG: DNA repair protein RecO [Pedobacter sp.]|nr:MAG: DNA repair protein RecO [Pedobacter sp.]
MLIKTRGIVLKTTAFSESSVIAKIFTESLGMQSYLINGVKKPRAKIPMNFLQSLHLLEFVFNQKSGGGLQRLSEANLSPAFRSIPYNLIKNTIVQFLNEVIYKSVHQDHKDENLFHFIYHALCWFDEVEEADVNFHLSFLLKLSRYLGFGPNLENNPLGNFFDLQEGDYQFMPPAHPYYLEKEDANAFFLLYQTSFENLNEIFLTRSQRKSLLDKILIYYNLHTASFGQIKSHLVLEEILS